ncbi:MAG: MFS transporter [Clostridia bacterium]|nr:MFS transporter [Clostridia bacterium]
MSMAVMGSANMPQINMNLLILKNVGGTVTHTGIATAFNTVAEFVAMRYPKPYSRFTAHQRLLGAGALYIASTVMMLIAGGVWMLYAASVVNGIAYGILLPARRQFVNEVTPPEAQNRAQGLGDMGYLNFGGLVGNQASGLIIDSLGVRVMLLVFLVVQTVGVTGLALLGKAAKRARLSANNG